MRRLRSGRDDDGVGGQPALGAVACGDGDRVRVGEARSADDERHAIAPQLVADDLPLALDDLPHPDRDVVDRDVVLQPVVLPVDRALVEAGEVEDRLADRLRRDRSGVDARAADLAVPLDERDAVAELRGLDRRLLPRGTGAEDDELEVGAHLAAPNAGSGLACLGS